MDEDRRNVIIEGIENFIETKNRYIQVILALITVIAGAIYGFAPEDAQTAIRYVLIMDLFVEIYVLQTKDSITQGKLNLLLVDESIRKHSLRFEKDIEIEREGFFIDAKKDFFISGIAPSRFITKFKTKMENILERNEKLKIYLLISSVDAVSENCAAYYGSRDNKDYRRDILNKMEVVINEILNSECLKKAFIEERLLLATSDIVFTTSSVAHDLFSELRYPGKIKITFYQQGVTKPEMLPSVCFGSDKNSKDMYPYFQEIAVQQWKSAKPISNEDALRALSERIINELDKCRY